MANQEKNKVDDKVFEMMNQVTVKDTIDIINAKTDVEEPDVYTQKARRIREGMERPNYDAITGERVGESTHIMSHEFIEGRWVAFPSLFPDWGGIKGEWKEFESYEDDDEKNYQSMINAYKTAVERGEIFEFGADEKAAERFALGSWKPLK